MERRLLSPLGEESRRNLVDTYLGLALAARGVKADVRPEWTWVTGVAPISFCNFVANFDLTESQVEKSIPLFREFGNRANAFWVFVTDFESPHDLGQRMVNAGFEVRQRLVQIAWEGGRVAAEGIVAVEARTTPDRLRVARFMTDTFFARSTGENRRLVIDATTHSPHRMFSWTDGAGIAAAVMVSESPGVLGLYNLCVRTDVRERGYGTEAVGFVQELAASMGRALVLQCQADMVDWYAKRGFDHVGLLTAFGVGPSRG